MSRWVDIRKYGVLLFLSGTALLVVSMSSAAAIFSGNVELYKKLMALGNKDLSVNIRAHYRNKSPCKRLNCLLQLSLSGHVGAISALSWVLQRGDGVEPDLSLAIQLYQIAAKQGDIDAQASLGEFYYEGLGVNKDLSLAFFWIEKAANQGHIHAMTSLGWLYFSGTSVEKDESKGAQLFLQAARADYVYAQTTLAWMYRAGRGLPQSDADAEYWLQRAAISGDQFAQIELSNRSDKEDAYSKAKAAYWDRLVAEQNCGKHELIKDDHKEPNHQLFSVACKI